MNYIAPDLSKQNSFTFGHAWQISGINAHLATARMVVGMPFTSSLCSFCIQGSSELQEMSCSLSCPRFCCCVFFGLRWATLALFSPCFGRTVSPLPFFQSEIRKAGIRCIPCRTGLFLRGRAL